MYPLPVPTDYFDDRVRPSRPFHDFHAAKYPTRSRVLVLWELIASVSSTWYFTTIS